ncbi:MAG: PDGLE domain-containing protein [Candidatus Humimicrobiaceae bacterium]|jgi:cobalt/nickel transport protein|nr:PDGLE domain-containing protein [Actinomycetota bacterium]MDD5601276.1 PDGLE domain-containing protein [Actinomycetota bacterium]MDY0028148.1 PDGLE domain-containing protein [Candidatus Humimicrobiaceae bacterium]
MKEKEIKISVIAGIILSIVIAVFISPFASSHPDGLEKVAEDFGFIEKAQNIVNDNIFLIPDYKIDAVRSPLWQGPLAGLSGVFIILAIFGIVFLIYRATSKNKSK